MKISVFYFSGTGNTQLVSENLADRFRELGYKTVLKRLEKADLPGIVGDIAESDLIGIGSPIFGGGTPGVVFDFIKLMPEVKSKPLFLFRTAADFINFNHAASAGLIRKLNKKGYNVFYERIIVMGSNWLIEYDSAFVKQLYEAVPDKIVNMAKEITSGTKRMYEPSKALVVFTTVLNFFEEKVGARMFGLTLHADKSCMKCGLCAENCPVGNISFNNRIKFNSKCLMCMRCVYSCPVNAIKSRGMCYCILSGGYDINKIINSTYDNKNYSPATRRLMKHFSEYLADPRL